MPVGVLLKTPTSPRFETPVHSPCLTETEAALAFVISTLFTANSTVLSLNPKFDVEIGDVLPAGSVEYAVSVCWPATPCSELTFCVIEKEPLAPFAIP